MAVRTFYGTCKTASGESEKKVYVPDTDLAGDFNFEEGNLLVVFFAQTNTVSEPSIVVYLQDPEEELSTTTDSGKLIKSTDVEANMENAWAAGETVIFAYTQLAIAGVYYWELIDAFHATTDTYGNTKLFDDTDFITWIGEPVDEEDSTIALTPNTLKKFFNLLKSTQSSEEEPEVEPLIGLYWEPAIEGDVQVLGNLSLSNGQDELDWLEITYPLGEAIQNYISEEGIQAINYTGELINNGNGYNNDATAIPIGEEDGVAEPFITRVIPDDLYFGINNGLYYGVPYYDFEHEGEEPEDTAWPRIILNDTNNYLVLGNNSDNTLAGIKLNKSTEINGNLNTRGTIQASGVITASLGQTPETAVSSVGFTTNGVIQEKNVPLTDRYSPQLKVVRFRDRTGPTNSGACCRKTDPVDGQTRVHIHIDVEEEGWTPIGVVGYNLDYVPGLSPTDADAPYGNVWECYLAEINGHKYVEYSILNTKNREVYLDMYVDVLYQKVL